jgi:hypothetical protein
MKHLNKLLIAFCLIAFVSTIQAQNTTSATGGSATGDGGVVSYTIGQAFYITNTGTTASLAEGVQQAYEISIETGIEETGINMNISVYPNPTQHYLHLEIDASTFQSNQTLRYQLVDINGRLIDSERIVGNVTTIVTTNLSPATYFVRVLGEDRELKTFKIIKY